jgi:hypothetical protein
MLGLNGYREIYHRVEAHNFNDELKTVGIGRMLFSGLCVSAITYLALDALGYTAIASTAAIAVPIVLITLGGIAAAIAAYVEYASSLANMKVKK